MLNWLKTLIEASGLSYGNIFTIILLACSIFIEITPIKINPISWLVGFIFKPIRQDINDMRTELNNNIESVKNELKSDIESIKREQFDQKESIDDLVRANEMNEVSRIRWEIIEFANSIENKQLHIRDEYRHIIDDNKRYHALIEKYELDNGIIDEEYEKIYKHYKENKNGNSVYF